MKWLMALGLTISIIGTVMAGFIAPRGIPRKGTRIDAPMEKLSYVGWSLILLGFILQLVSTIIE